MFLILAGLAQESQAKTARKFCEKNCYTCVIFDARCWVSRLQTRHACIKTEHEALQETEGAARVSDDTPSRTCSAPGLVLCMIHG